MITPDICIAIPTYNREEVLIDTIHGVLMQTYKNLELLVVDQTLEHKYETKDALEKIKDPRFRYIKAGPPSLPAARNFSLRASKAPIVLFLDDDVVLQPDMVAWHLKTFEDFPDVSAVGGRVLQKDFPIKKDVLKFDDFAVSHGVFTATKASYTNAFPGGNHSIIVKDALKAGGYDTRFYGNAFREESDMSLRLINSGKKIYYEPRAELLHLAAHYGGVESRVKGHIYDNRLFYRNELFFTIRNVKKSHTIRALHRKYSEYCKVPGKKIRLRRSVYFFEGLIAAVWRQVFGVQIITKEIK
ncbi:MAG: glycosyl transferase, family 2 [Candidatus Saccharibacteria bacterium]|nr:glycosyl transferase, family 2 [Candidatus Saccharibacteria bacterium]